MRKIKFTDNRGKQNIYTRNQMTKTEDSEKAELNTYSAYSGNDTASTDSELKNEPENPNDILRFLQESGIINMDDVRDEMNKRRKNEILKNHPYKIWQDKHGRWWTQIADPSKKEGRRKVVKSNLEDLLCWDRDH